MSEQNIELTTRNQLKGYGASRYQASILTKDIPVFGKEGQAYTYKIEDVIASIRKYLQKPRIKSSTHDVLEHILQSLLSRIGNLVKVSFGKAANSEVSNLSMRLSAAISDTDKKLARLKATVASIEGKKK